MGRVHFANWQVVENASVAALCDTAPSAADTAAQWGVPLYRSITQMVQDCNLDAVDICTPTFLHHDMVMESLNLGHGHHLREAHRPCTTQDSEGNAGYRQAKGCHLYIAQILQFTKEIQALRQLVKSEEYGKVLDASFERLSAAPRWAVGGWLFDKSKSGLLPFDLHIHDLDVIVSLFGKPERFTINTCHGRGKTYAEHLRIDYDFGDKHVNGEAAWFNADSPWTARWRVYFENAVVINDGKTMTAYTFDAPAQSV